MQYSYNDFQSKQNSNQNKSNYKGDGYQVGFFTLKDGEEAIVRIMHDSTDSFDTLIVHPVTIDGKYRKINCLRGINDPTEMCPLCEKGMKLEIHTYVHMLQYIKQADGTIKVEPKVWERSSAYMTKLKTLLDEYGPLSDVIFKIKRTGSGFNDTKYDILYVNQANYPSNIYVKDESVINSFKSLGTVVMNKTYEECLEFVGDSIPMPKDNLTEEFNNICPPQTSVPSQPISPTPNTNSPNPNPNYNNSTPNGTPIRTYAVGFDSSLGENRPIRNYNN